MGGGEIVRAPDGSRWRVRRRWLDRPAPRLRRSYRRNAKEASDGFFDSFSLFDFSDGVWWGLAAAVFGLVVILVVLPLLGVALEIVAVLFLLLWGLIGRLALGKPWWVEAVPVGGDVEERGVYAVKGWRASREAVRELATAIRATGEPPARLARGRRLTTRPAGAAAASAAAGEPTN